VIARVGEGMVSTIGSARTHKEVLENPDHISKHILSRGLDAGTAFEILSIAHSPEANIGWLEALFTATSAVCVTGAGARIGDEPPDLDHSRLRQSRW
jgi:hypothetical protein